MNYFLKILLIGVKIFAKVFLKKYTTVKQPAIKLCTIKPPKPGSIYAKKTSESNVHLEWNIVLQNFQDFFE
jgi:hypothetical protein